MPSVAAAAAARTPGALNRASTLTIKAEIAQWQLLTPIVILFRQTARL